MRHPAAALSSIESGLYGGQSGKRYALLGTNEFIRGMFKRVLEKVASHIQYESIDEADVRSSALFLRDSLLTTPMPWDKPVIWIDRAELLLAAMSYPEDLPQSSHCVIYACDNAEVYIPASVYAVTLDPKGGMISEFVRWLMTYKGLNGDSEVSKFLTSEYKDDLPELEKQLDQLMLSIHPRTVLTIRDLEPALLTWDATTMLQAIIKNEENKVLKEMVLALETFHPKGIITVLTKRTNILMQVMVANVMSDGQPESSEIKPWVWRTNAELVKDIPIKRLAQWAVTLDRAYAQLSRGTLSYRWTLTTTLLEMCRG